MVFPVVRCVVQVHRTPHVAILSTGDELVPAETAALEPGRIRDANRPMLIAAGEAWKLR